MTVGWVTEPPIYMANSPQGARTLLARLDANMAGWEAPPAIPGAPATASQWATDQWGVWPQQRQDWIDRVESSSGIIGDILEELGDEDVWFYMLGGQPIGAMTVIPHDTFIHIDYLVTHPGSSDCGGALIQKAVQLSSAAGFGGKLRLCAANEQAHSMYLHVGFVDIENGGVDDMELDPANSDKWQSSGESYRYKPYIAGSRWGS